MDGKAWEDKMAGKLVSCVFGTHMKRKVMGKPCINIVACQFSSH